MNKLFKYSLLALIAVPVLAGCNGGYNETRSEEQVLTDVTNQIIAEIGVAYSKFSSDGVAPGENELVTNVTKYVYEGDTVGLNFSISYTVVEQENYARDFLYISDDGSKLISVTVGDSEIASYPVASSLGGAAYFLKGAVKFEGYGEDFKVPGLKTTDDFVGGVTGEKSWNALVKSVFVGTMKEIKEESIAGNMVVVRGRVTAAYSWIYDEVFRGILLTDGDDGILLYAGCLQDSFYDSADGEMKIKKGDIIEVYGEVAPYNNLFEVKPSRVSIISDQVLIDSIAPTTYREPGSVTEFLKYKASDTGALAKLDGLYINMSKIALSKLEAGEHWDISCKDADGKVITISLNYHVTSEQQEAVREFLKNLNGASFSLVGMISAYGSINFAPVAIGDKTVVESFTLEA